MRRKRGCAGLSSGAGVEWDVTGISKCLSRYEKDLLCHVLSFLTLSLCAFSTSWELSHGMYSPLASAPGFYSLPLLCKNWNKWVFFFPEKCKNSRRKCVCVPCGMWCRDSQAALGNTGAVAWPGSAQDSWNESPGLSLQSSPWPKFNPLHFCNPVVSCSCWCLQAGGKTWLSVTALLCSSCFTDGNRLGSSSSYTPANGLFVSQTNGILHTRSIQQERWGLSVVWIIRMSENC